MEWKLYWVIKIKKKNKKTSNFEIIWTGKQLFPYLTKLGNWALDNVVEPTKNLGSYVPVMIFLSGFVKNKCFGFHYIVRWVIKQYLSKLKAS